MKILIPTLILMGSLSMSCLQQGALEQNGSGLSDLTLNLPDRVGEQKTKLSGYHLTIVADNDTCKSSNKDTKPKAWPTAAADKKLGGTVKQGCGYFIKLELGAIPKAAAPVAGTPTLAPTSLNPKYYSNAGTSGKGQFFAKDKIVGKSIDVTLTLQATADGQKEFPNNPSMTTPAGETDVNINVKFGNQQATTQPAANPGGDIDTASGLPKNVLAIVQKSCVNCHKAGGQNETLLNTATQWETKKVDINNRFAAAAAPMPPANAPAEQQITVAERAVIIQYIGSLKPNG